jgi:DNA-binding MarR family transcriptional regulator
MFDELPHRSELLDAIDRERRKLTARTILFHESVAARLGLNATDLKALNLASGIDPLTPGKLAELTGLTTGAITGVIDRLEKAGFVRRQRDSIDRRSVIIKWIPGREQEINQLFENLSPSIDALTARYRDEELALILGYMIQNNLTLEQETARLRRESAAARTQPKS